MIRVLQCVNNMHRAGLETMLMNYYRNIDRTKIQFDFLVHRQERSDYDDEIESLGGRIYRAPRLYPQNYPAYFAYMKRFFQEHPEYKIVHSHIDAMSYLPLLAAKNAGVPIRIAHSHNTAIDLDFKYPLKQIFRYMIGSVASHRFSCGQAAGEFLFRGKSFQVIPNAIDVTRFAFDPEVREAKREQLGVCNKFVMGHIGRFSYAKNHEFLIEIFSLVKKKEKDAVLILIGTGKKEKQIQELVRNKGLTESVLFMGKRSDVSELYQAMDVFVMPSLFEGVPVVGIEAQFSSLPCVFSKKVPQEVAFSERCVFVDLKLDADCWADTILGMRNCKRSPMNDLCSLYDIQRAHMFLEEQYLNLSNQL